MFHSSIELERVVVDLAAGVAAADVAATGRQSIAATLADLRERFSSRDGLLLKFDDMRHMRDKSGQIAVWRYTPGVYVLQVGVNFQRADTAAEAMDALEQHLTRCAIEWSD